MERGQGKPSPYETLKLFAKKTRIYRTAMQRGKAAKASQKAKRKRQK
jgi:hypothetical protein